MSPDPFEHVRGRLAARVPQRVDASGGIEAAVAVVLAAGPSGALDILLIKRAEREGDPWSGQMALPGGRRERGDPDLLTTARREAREETGIVLGPGELLGELDDLEPRTRILPPVVVRPFVFGLPARPEIRASDEVELHLWTVFDALMERESETEVTIRDTSRIVPAFLLGTHVVWGMTHRILSGFRELIV